MAVDVASETMPFNSEAAEARVQFCLLGASRQQAAALRAGKTNWLTCRRSGPMVYEFLDGDRRLAALDLVKPVWSLADVAAILGQEGNADLSDLRHAWNERFPAHPMRFLEVSDFAPASVLAAANAVLSDMLMQERRGRGAAIWELATYREEFERLQRNFAAAEGFLAASGANAAQLAFDYDFSGEAADAAALAGAGEAEQAALELRQLLPVAPVGVSGIELWLNHEPTPGEPPLRVALRAEERAEALVNWEISAPKARKGWVRLALDRALDVAALDLSLVVQWPSINSRWSLGLGGQHPAASMCAHGASSSVSLGAPLAMRLYRAPPGVRVVKPADAIGPAYAQPVEACWVPEAAMQRVASAPPNSGGDEYVVFDPAGRFVQVHPKTAGEPCIGRIVVEAPAGAWCVSCRIKLAHADARRVSFALVAANGDRAAPDPAMLSETTGGLGFSGWRALDPLQEQRLFATVPDQAGGELTIFMLTRQDSRPEFAWARFSDLQFHIRRGAMAPAALGESAAARTQE